MLLLALSGAALSESFAGQRHLDVLEDESSQAHWIAEAGLWHAAAADQAIIAPVSFGGGRYTVTKNGTVFTATAELDEALVVLTRDFAGAFEAPAGPSGPLDVPATEDSVTQVSGDAFNISLTNVSGENLLLQGFELSADGPHPPLHWMTLEGWAIVHAHNNNDLPTGYWPTPWGVFLGGFFNPNLPLDLQLEFEWNPTGTVEYTLVLHFEGLESVTLNFQVDW